MSELKPCPICGSTAAIQKIDPRLYRPTRNHPYSVICYNCDLIFGYDIDYGGIFDTEEEAAEAWNRRSGEQERKKGEWIVTSEFEDCRYAKCNQCKTTQVFYYNKPLTNFCPMCGADLRGKHGMDS